MGVDLYNWIEYDKVGTLPFNSSSNIVCLDDDRCTIGRKRFLFELLVGYEFTPKEPSLIQPRGFPTCVSREVYNEYYWPISINEYTPEKADAWVKKGLSFYITDSDGLQRVKNPGAYNVSWLYWPEIVSILEGRDIAISDYVDVEYIVKKMQSLSKDPKRVRMIFWVDCWLNQEAK